MVPVYNSLMELLCLNEYLYLKILSGDAGKKVWSFWLTMAWLYSVSGMLIERRCK